MISLCCCPGSPVFSQSIWVWVELHRAHQLGDVGTSFPSPIPRGLFSFSPIFKLLFRYVSIFFKEKVTFSSLPFTQITSLRCFLWLANHAFNSHCMHTFHSTVFSCLLIFQTLDVVQTLLYYFLWSLSSTLSSSDGFWSSWPPSLCIHKVHNAGISDLLAEKVIWFSIQIPSWWRQKKERKRICIHI